MDFQRFSLKKRSSNNAMNTRGRKSTPTLPPAIVHVEKPPSRSDKARIKPSVMFSTKQDMKSRAAAGLSTSLPTSPTFDSEEETAVGEPLIQDYATSSIPKEYKPYVPSRSPERARRPGKPFPIQQALSALSSDDEDGFFPKPSSQYETQGFSKWETSREPKRDTKRDTSVYVPTRTRYVDFPIISATCRLDSDRYNLIAAPKPTTITASTRSINLKPNLTCQSLTVATISSGRVYKHNGRALLAGRLAEETQTQLAKSTTSEATMRAISTMKKEPSIRPRRPPKPV
jgi:hypothetical protein